MSENNEQPSIPATFWKLPVCLTTVFFNPCFLIIFKVLAQRIEKIMSLVQYCSANKLHISLFTDFFYSTLGCRNKQQICTRLF